MLKYYIKSNEALKRLRTDAREAVERLRTDKDGVVSFEYVIVAACIIGAVVAAFGTGSGGAIATALTSGITAIVGQFNAAV
jgi:hypothetical protein